MNKIRRSESALDLHLNKLSDLEYKKWATQHKLSRHTKEMLAFEHFDSMATLRMLRPDMIDLLHLNESEKHRLLKALGSLHLNSGGPEPDVTMDSGYAEESSDSGSDGSDFRGPSGMKHSNSLPTIFSGNFLPGKHVSVPRRRNWEEISGGSPSSFYMNSIEDNQSIITADSDSVHSLRDEELRDLLDYMVLEGITTRGCQEEIVSQRSFRKKIQLLQNIMTDSGAKTRMHLESVIRSNYHAALPVVCSQEDEISTSKCSEISDNWNMRSGLMPKRVSWKSSLSTNDSYNDNNNGSKDSFKSGSTVAIEPEVFVIQVDGNKSKCYDNLYFENDDGKVDVPKCPVLKFGHKGRQDGELQDATSVTSLNDSEIIVTDLVKSKLQIFDNFGAPVRTISVTGKYQPWNVALSPIGWIAVTFRGSKSLTILDRSGKEIASLGEEMYKNPTGLAVDQCDRFIVTDAISNCVFIHSYSNETRDFLTQRLGPSIEFNQPRYVTVSPNGNIIVSDTGNHCVKVFSQRGNFLLEFGSYGQTPGQFRCPYGICTDLHGNILVADHYNNRVAMFDEQGHFIRNLLIGSDGLKRPQGLHISEDQKLFITHGRMKASEILVFDLAAFQDNGEEMTYL